MNKFNFDEYFSTIYSRFPVSDGSPGEWIAAGCSHTAGFGVDAGEIYIDHLSQHYSRPIHNLALGMANHSICRHNCQQWIEQYGAPGLVLIQWPNPIRRTTWTNNHGELVSISQSDSVLHTMLRAGEQNLLSDWLDSIIILNQFCKAYSVPIINIMLETLPEVAEKILTNCNIKIHDDKKQPGLSWIFDNAGTDMQHHSARCHKLWSERLIGIIDEYTTP